VKIFFICQRVPFPPDRGDKITTYNEIKHLCREHEVYVFCLADGEKDLENVAGAQGFAREVTAVPVTHWGTRLRALLALFTGAPLTVAMLRQAKLHQAVARRFGEVKPDLVFVYSSNTAQYAEPFAGVPRIMQFADLDSLKWRRYAERASVPMRWIYALEARRLLAYEQKIARSFSHSLLCTDAEVRDFEAVVPGAPVSTVGNGVDLDYFRTKGAAKVAGSIVFTGLMDYLPNVDAVVWFCDEILPLVQARVPSASFVICGNRPTAGCSDSRCGRG
jgi:sugar transferase (PEP-CTERM/EpsH1 system associated)